MLYKKNFQKTLDEKLFKNPTAEYRGTPFWAWNCKLNENMLLEQIEYLKEMGFGGFYMHTRAGMETPYLGEEFMNMVMVSPTVYSVLYNGTYMLPNTILAVAICAGERKRR